MKGKDVASSSSLILLSAQLRLQEKSTVSALYLIPLDLVATLLVFRQTSK